MPTAVTSPLLQHPEQAVPGARRLGGLRLPAPAVPLRWKLGALAVTLAVVPLTVVGVVLIDVNRDAVETLSRDVQLAVLDDLTRSIDAELSAAQDGLETVGHVLADPGRDPDAAVDAASALVVGREALDHVALYDRDGLLIDVLRDETAAGVAVPDTLPTELQRAAERDDLATGNAQSFAGIVRVPLVVPIRGAEYAVTGFAASWVSLQPLQARVQRIAAERFPRVDGAIVVVDRRGRVLLHANPALAQDLPEASDVGLLADVRAGLIDHGVRVSREEEGMVSSGRALDGRGWVIVVQVPTSVVYASLYRAMWIVAGTVFVAILAAIAAGLLMSRRITAPVAELVRMAGDLAARRFDRRVGVRTRDELAVLGAAMDGAASDLADSEAKLQHEAAVRADLGRYLPAEIVERVVRREQDMALGGARRSISVLFADVVGFTPITERLRPEDTVTVLNELFTILTEIVFRHGGTVDKFVGDSVMAMWGAPTDCADHAQRAVGAAEDMLRFLEAGAVTWRERYGVEVRLAIGVHSGECVVGNVGSTTRMEYTAIGDVVNVAARLEVLARPNQILLTSQTRDALGAGWEATDLGEHELSGRSAPVRVYELGTL